MNKVVWQQMLHDYMQELSQAASNLESIMSKYPCDEGEKPDRKRMRQDIKEVLDDYSTPEMKRLTDLLRKLPSFHKRANELNGKEWLQNSISVWDDIPISVWDDIPISVWDDIRKSAEERKLRHPAMFPAELAKRLIACFTNGNQDTILDPFAGVGSTLMAAKALNKDAIGIELSQEFTDIAMSRIDNAETQLTLFDEVESNVEIHVVDSRTLCQYVDKNSVDMVVTSPPYWDILIEKRPLYPKENANYGDTENDLGKLRDYDEFLSELKAVFEQVYQVMKPNTYCCIVVMDIRKGNRLYPLHMDISMFMEDIGYQLDDLIIWNRSQDYNYLYTLGYPSKFRINRIHEFILIFHKPEDTHAI